VRGWEAKGTNRSTECFLRTWGSTFVLCVWWSSGTDCPEAVGSPPWGSPDVAWLWAWAPCSGWHCWSRGWPRGTQRSLPASAILCFCDSLKFLDRKALVKYHLNIIILLDFKINYESWNTGIGSYVQWSQNKSTIKQNSWHKSETRKHERQK